MSVSKLAAAVLLLGACASVPAAELEGVTMPDRIVVDGKDLVLNGMGLREATFFKVDVYVAGLYLQERSSDPGRILDSGGIKRIVMHFVYSRVDREKLVEAWGEGLQENLGSDLERLRPALAQLDGWMETVEAGDTMVFTALPGRGLEVEIKGRIKGIIADPDFARLFWAVWLGPEPPNPGLKRGLLGLD
ncbi:MAG TPA: chalcone isomerase family protein [bacterium]|nr:chalcone isomerase family protein [bacterium]HPJ71706.1 chalcone isomerase family protein [bacterium]HPQ66335.1 chalcone isomerase family protein [bacterium]